MIYSLVALVVIVVVLLLGAVMFVRRMGQMFFDELPLMPLSSPSHVGPKPEDRYGSY